MKVLELVLIVEDDAELRQLLAEFLVSEGFNVRSAEHGIEALRFLDHRTPAIVVLDLALPWMDGIAVLSTMRSQLRTARIPVVVITGTDVTEQALRGLGPVRLLRKPFEPPELLAVIGETLN